MTHTLKLGILLSGRGSNFEAIARNTLSGALPVEIAVVISNKPDAKGLEIARQLGFDAVALPSKGLDRETYDLQVVAALRSRGVDLVCLAGYMRLLSAAFVREFPIHPSLLPAFPGLDAQQQAFDYGVKVTGCTVHFVDEQLDHGPIILQSPVPVLPADTAETLSARILAEEHKIYSEAIGIIAGSKFRIEGRNVVREV